MISTIVSLITGGIAGWIAGKVMNSQKSIIFNIVLGLVGGLVGSFALSLFGLYNYGFISSVVSSTIGAIIIIYLGRLLLKK